MAEYLDGNSDSLHLYNLMRSAVKSTGLFFAESLEEHSKKLPFAYAEIGGQSAQVITRGHTKRANNHFRTNGAIHLFVDGNEYGTGQQKIKDFDKYLRNQDIINDFNFYHSQEPDGSHHFTLTIKGGM